MTDENEGLDLESLYADRTPPPGLEERVVADWLRASAVDASTHPISTRTPVRAWPYRIAASLVLFAAGWGTARATAAPGDQAGADFAPRAAMLLWEGPSFGQGEDRTTFHDEYAAWAERTAGAGVGISGEEIGRSPVWFAPAQATAETPPDLGGLHVGGFFLIDADEATVRRLAARHPHLSHGGWISVARVVGP